jgi:hypothetical protein
MIDKVSMTLSSFFAIRVSGLEIVSMHFRSTKATNSYYYNLEEPDSIEIELELVNEFDKPGVERPSNIPDVTDLAFKVCSLAF